VVERGVARSYRHFDTEEEAKEAVTLARREAARECAISLDDALADYEAYLKEKGNRPRTVATTLYRLGVFFRPIRRQPITALRGAGEKLSRAMTAQDGGKTLSVDSRMNTVAEAKTFASWLVRKGWLKVNPLAEVVIEGRRKRGKPQLRIDEARRWLDKALELAAGGDDRAVAAAMALVMGLRASEISNRIARDLDDEGRLLWITDAKTAKGNRRLAVPPILQPLLLAIAKTKEPDQLLFGDANRWWVWRQVRLICRLAKVPLVSAHGMRGLHATLAVEAGATGSAVAAALGHESFTTTARHYAKPEALHQAQQDRVSGALAGRAGSNEKFPRVPARPDRMRKAA